MSVLTDRITEIIDLCAEWEGHNRVSAPHNNCEICELRAIIKRFVNQQKEQQNAGRKTTERT